MEFFGFKGLEKVMPSRCQMLQLSTLGAVGADMATPRKGDLCELKTVIGVHDQRVEGLATVPEE